MSCKKHPRVQSDIPEKQTIKSIGQNQWTGLTILDYLIGHLQVGGSTDRIMYFHYDEGDNFSNEVNTLTEGAIDLRPVVKTKLLKKLILQFLQTSEDVKKFKVQRRKSRRSSGTRVLYSFVYHGRSFHLPAPCTRNKPRWLATLGSFYYLGGVNSGIQALYFSRATLEVIYDDLPRARYLPVNDLLKIFYVSSKWPLDNFTKNAKYFSLVPMARFLKNEYPEIPPNYGTSNELIFEGQLKKMIKARLISYNNHRAAHLPWSLLQGVKRGCYEIPKEFKQSEYEKHAKDLNNHFDDSFDPVQELRTGRKDYIAEALKGVRPIKEYRLYEPSNSASFRSPRDKGGARTEVQDFLELFGVVEKVTGYTLTSDMDIQALMTYNLNDSDLRNQIIHAVYEAVSEKEYLDVMVHGIAEPLKFRKITKGEALPYWIARQFQKSMWEYLQNLGSSKRQYQFSPTGRPLETADIYFLNDRREDLEERILMSYGININFDKWVSGDYSAATDLVDMRVTMSVFEEFADRFKISDEIRSICRKVIGPQRINYPVHTGIDSFVQENGQLMGSVLSFPILCIINLVSYWAALEEYISSEVNLKWRKTPRNTIRRIDIPLTKLPVMVNGDDILFPANDDFYRYWKKWTKRVGFQLSLGKNYISSKYLTVNSKLFKVTNMTHVGEPHGKVSDFKVTEVPYFNVGLLTGQSKLSGVSHERIVPLWDIHNWTIQGASDPYRASRRFIHYNMKNILKATWGGRFNLFIDHIKGGLGFQQPKEVIRERVLDGYYHQVPDNLVKQDEYFRVFVTKFQRKFAWTVFREHRVYDPESAGKPTRIGLIQTNKPQPRFKDFAHNPVHPVLLPKYGPYRENVVHNRDYDTLDFVPGSEILMDEPTIGRKPDLFIKVPRLLVEKAKLIRVDNYPSKFIKSILAPSYEQPVPGFVKPKPVGLSMPQEILERIHKFAYPEFHQKLQEKSAEIHIFNLFQ